MIDLDKMQRIAERAVHIKAEKEQVFDSEEMLFVITRMRQAEKLNAELKDRISNIGMDVGIATTGQVPSEHPIKSRLEMVAKLAKDATRYRWLKEQGRHDYDVDDFFDGSCDRIDSKVDEAMQCNK